MMKKYIYIIISSMMILFGSLFNISYTKGAGNYQIDTSKDVGDIPYETNVTPQGALVYTVPIPCYQASSGFQPNISLTYNSMSGMGTAGMGWAVGGISTISRVNRTNYYDGEVAPAIFSDSVAFALDGVRLVQKEGSDLLVTEQGNILVKKLIAENGNMSFEVLYPNGSKAIYKKESQNGLSYPITRMEDKLGNWISYNYRNNEDLNYIYYIFYGSKGQDSVGGIVFDYERVEVKDTVYFDGKKIYQHYLLKEIMTKEPGVLYKYRYNLTYTHNEAKNLYLLDQIGKNIVGTNQNFNPLRFTYGSEKEEKLEVTKRELANFSEQIDSTMLIMPIKFSSKEPTNGLIFMPSKDTYNFVHNPVGGSNHSAVSFSQYWYKDSAYIYKDITDTTLLPKTICLKGKTFENLYGGSFRGLLPIDYLGSGNNFLVKISERMKDGHKGANKYPTSLIFESFNSDGILVDSFQIHTIEKPIETKEVVASISKSYLVGDFLGDGYESILYITHNKDFRGDKRASRAILVDLNKKKVLYDEECFGVSFEDIITVGDFDGDGVSEIIHIGTFNVNMSVYKFEKNMQLKKIAHDARPISPTYGSSDGGPNYFYLFGDMNGDGKTDVVMAPFLGSYGGKVWQVFYSNGKDGFDIRKDERSKKPEDQLTIYNPNYSYSLQDIDGDGLPDMIVMDDKGDSKIYKNKNGYFDNNPIAIPEKLDTRSKLLITRVREANKLYPIMGIQGNNLTLISNSVNQQENRMMSSSTNSYGIRTDYSYGTLTNKNICSVNEEKNLDFPYNYFVEDMYVLNNIETKYSGNSIFSKTYKYDSPVIHRHGLGFRGFEKVSVADNLRKEYTVQTFDPLKLGVLTDLKSSNMHITSEYDTLFTSNKRVQILLKKEVKKDLLKGTISTSTYKYDFYGNLTEQNVDLGEGIKSQTSYILDNFDNNNFYLLGILKEELQTNTRNDQSASSKSVTEYNNDFLPTNIKSYYNNHLVSEKSYQYDGLANLIESKVKSFDSSDWLVTSYEYDDYGRKIKETDALDFTTEFLYEGKALLQAVKNYKGHTIRYDYDNWNRNVKTTYADGTIESTELVWDSSIPGAIYASVTKKSGEPESKVYSDALGREIRIGSQRFDGNYLYTEKEYDNLGRVKRESLPFKGSSPTLWNEYTYDAYDRIKSITYASGKKDAFAYNKQKIRSVIDGVETTKAYDASGELIRTTDTSGSIVYNLRADGQPESVVAPGDITMTFEYDKYGRQIAIIDPSAGTKQFEYDAAGNIQKDIDARGKITTYKYDKYNRLLEKEIKDEFVTLYEYNTDNLLVKESSTNGTSKEFSYDSFFRLKTSKESIVDGKWFEQTFSYRPDGNIESTDYKSQSGAIAIENYEYSNGHRTELKINNNQSIWKLTAENDMGMPIASKTGVIDREYSYDTYGLPTGRILKTGQGIMQDFGYKFDSKTGNLFWRKDNTRNIREDFTYDELNRLTGFGDVTIQYNHLGNIIDHSSVGYFSYNQAKPYAIEKVEPYTQEIPQHTQDIVYNAQMRPLSISENGYKALFTYDTNGNRIKMNLTLNDTLRLNRYYIGGVYEIEETLAGQTERLYLGGNAYTAAAVLEKDGTDWKISYIGRDYLGSITHIIDATGIVNQELSYDPWGRLRDPKTQEVYDITQEIYPALAYRGYTGHEHLPMFGLINMNARLYDPIVGRFLSPDPYVQDPGFGQNFNRYSYALNNPLRYTDPNGEFFIAPIVIVAAATFATGYVAHGITTGNWGFQAIVTGGISSLSASIAFSTMGGGTALSALIFAGKDAANTILSNIVPPINLQFGDFGVSLSPTAMLTAGIGNIALGEGFKFGGAISISQRIGDVTLMASGSLLQGGPGKGLKNTWSAGFSYDDGNFGFTYMYNKYNYGKEPGAKQATGTFGFRSKDFSFKFENDLFANSGDKQRTAAIELGYKDYVAGFNIYTTDPGENDYDTDPTGKNPTGIHHNGYQWASPAYIGVSNGRSITRIGLNRPEVGYLQNGLHRANVLGKRLMNSGDFQYGDYSNFYINKGSSANPYSLYTY